MRPSIPITLAEPAAVEVDAGVVAKGLGLEPADLRRLMDERRIRVLCERGTGEHAGLYRASFYHAGRRLRLVVDAEGRPVEPPQASGG